MLYKSVALEYFTNFESSNVRWFAYNAANSELKVAFISGGEYIYSPVPAETFDRFKAAPSKGRFVHRILKPYFAVRKTSS